MNGLEHFLIALTLAFVSQWVLQQYHKAKYKEEKPFSMSELGVLLIAYLVLIYFIESSSSPTGGRGSPTPALVKGGGGSGSGGSGSITAVAPMTYLSHIQEHIMTGLPPF